MNSINVLNFFWWLIQIVIGYNLFFPLILYFLFQFKKRSSKNFDLVAREADYAIIVTAFQQTALLPTVVDSLLKLNYSNYIIYIVADNCDISNLSFSSPKVVLLRPEQMLASNTRSHFYAINNFKRLHERLTIIDSDNLVEPEYLNELNKFFDKGYLAVQGVREAKNLNTTYARLDAARDIFYHYYDGKLLFNCGSSATLAGSGMAFTTELYRECLEKLDIKGAGFDKVLQYEIVKRNHRIAFNEAAIVYDEKTSKPDQLVNQRARWINTWFKYFALGFILIKSGILRGSFNQFLFGVILLRPPLFIFIILSGICFLINIIINPFVALLWLVAFIAFATGFWVALKKNNTNKLIYDSLISIPKFIYFQLVSLMNVRSANKKSIATTHFQPMEVKELNKKP